MVRIEQTKLPGVGVRYDFTTAGGRQVGVIVHRGGVRELLLYDYADVDTVVATLRLDEPDSLAMAELLGAPQLATSLGKIRHSVEGLTIDWVPLERGWAAAGATIGDTQMRRRTGVSIVALIRGDTTIPSPEPSQRLMAGDTAVVVGTPDGISRAVRLLRENRSDP